MSGPRAYTPLTLKKLFALAGNLCSFPDCDKQMVNQKNARDSNICHIEGAKKGSERYNPKMLDEERADYKNLILLCVQHHDETNDVEKYSVSELLKIKRDHEASCSQTQMRKRPSILNDTLSALAKTNLTVSDEEKEQLSSYKISEKIKYNKLQKNQLIIEDYKIYHGKLNSLYKVMERNGSDVKEGLLGKINIIYLQVLGELIIQGSSREEVAQNNSDSIFDEVYNRMYEELDCNGLADENIVLGLYIIIVDAFIRCKILEEPK